MSVILEGLNPHQQEAVSSNQQHLLVLAGAGSGKTKILTHRFAWQVFEKQMNPNCIVCVTFTNKAANEMKQRIAKLTQLNAFDLNVGTFHGIAHQFLRRFHKQAGLPHAFQILDTSDQEGVIKKIIQNMGLDLLDCPVKDAQRFINKKSEGHDTQTSFASHEIYESIHAKYEKQCQENGWVDFNQLLLRMYLLFKDNPQAAQYAKNFIKCVMVDEFQDVNHLQYQWIKLLGEYGADLFAVGDDDQTIYSWRGSNALTMKNFLDHFSNTKLIRLETNYRSASCILEAANALIEKNKNRLGKNLQSESTLKGQIICFGFDNEYEESQQIARAIHTIIDQNVDQTTAILYRNNRQSRILEIALNNSSINYEIYGGMRFFSRAEIKNIFAYMQLILNTNNNYAFTQVINKPARGIGEQTLAVIENLAQTQHISLFEALTVLIDTDQLNRRSTPPCQNFLKHINELSNRITRIALPDLLETIIRSMGIEAHYKNSNDPAHQTRLDNLNELIQAGEDFCNQPEQKTQTNEDIASEFINQNMLDAPHKTQQSARVVLSTLHSAKGLEFNHVFLAGLEDGVIPSYNSLDTEEERRLLYVGMTRAKQTLYLCYARSRYKKPAYPSSFLREIPQIQNNKQPAYAPITSKQPSRTPYKIGQKIIHDRFGVGYIVKIIGKDDEQIAEICFQNYGTKQIMLSIANMTIPS